MNTVDKKRRQEEIAKLIRRRQAQAGDDSPFPSYLNVATELIIDIEDKAKRAEDKAKAAQATANEALSIARSVDNRTGLIGH